jgi:PST family polysaccharide transporter
LIKPLRLKKVLSSSIFHNFSWLFADKVIRLALSVFVSVVVARFLGPDNYGIWNYLLSITMFFTAFVSLGMDNILPRELINEPDDEIAIISTSYILKLSGGIIGFILSILIFILYRSPDSNLLLMMSLMASLLIFQSADVSDIFFKAKLQAKYSVIGRNLAFVIVAGLKLYFVYAEYNLIYFVASNAFEMLLGGIFVFSIYFKKGNTISFKRFERGLAKRFLKDGFPMALSGLMVMLYMRVDQVMLTDIAGDTANGIYSTGVRMIEIVYFIPMALADSFFPGIVYSKKHEGEKYEKNMLGFYSIMTYISLFIGIITVIIAIPMMDLLFGAEYDGSGAVLQVFGLSIYATFLTVASGKYLVAENYKKVILLRSLLGLAVNVGLNLIWIPQYGFMGAAYASFISYFIPILIMLLFSSTRKQLLLMIRAFNPTYLIAKLRGMS